MSNIIGISAFYHDSAAALIKNGEIIAASQEERFTREKHDPSFPTKSIEYCLNEGKISLQDVEAVVFYEKPFLKFERLLENYVLTAPFSYKSFSMSMPLWIKEKLFQKYLLGKNLKKIDKNFDTKKIMFSEHHFSHAASAFFPSPFDEAIILNLDGVGEWATSTLAIGKKNKIRIISEINFPHSLGLLYSAFTYYLGFKVNSGEYKIMGLAPYGKPIYEELIFDKIVDLKNDGSFRLNQKYFNYCYGLTMTNSRFDNLFKKKRRKPETENLTDFHMNIAASIQTVTEKIILNITDHVSRKYNISNLCLSGGVALNCVANGKILKQKKFKNLWIQPAAGDAGGSLGAAFAYWYDIKNNKRIANKNDSMKGSFLGPSYSNQKVETELSKLKAKYNYMNESDLIDTVAELIKNGKAIGWFQGRMEFGPRALGCRSILADPRSEKMQKILNLKVKYRESFRPFAPSILKEEVSHFFDLNVESPYMLLVANVNEGLKKQMSKEQENLFGIDKLNVIRSNIPSVTHVDYSARIQTVSKETNYRYYSLINKFKELTGYPILINTSFNVRGEPIVNTVEDAFRCFMGCELDILVIENYILYKDRQDIKLKEDYKNKYQLD